MSLYEELLAQRAELEKQIEETKAKEFAAVITEIKRKIANYGITLADLGIRQTRHAKSQRSKTPRHLRALQKHRRLPPKYRDPQTGAIWSGRGRAPTWIIGKDRELYLIQNAKEMEIREIRRISASTGTDPAAYTEFRKG